MIGGGEIESGGTSFGALVLGGTYRLVGRLGTGGMGDVFHGEHVRLGSPVAIKLLRRSTEHSRSVQRFLQEARTLASIRSDYVVRVFDLGESFEGVPYLVMERLYGEDLRVLLTREGRLPVRRAVRLVMNACRGLSVAHASGLVHRDLKPANLFVESVDQSTERCKILDFGVAKEIANDATHPGALLGTIRYMAPEQLEDARLATPRADIYALGAILFEALAGRPVNAGTTNAEIMFRSLHRDAPRLGECIAVPSELERIVGRSLSRDPRQRFGSVEELERALAPFGPDGFGVVQPMASESTTVEDGARVTYEPRRLPHARWVVVGALALGAAGGWVMRAFDSTSSAAVIASSSPQRPEVLPCASIVAEDVVTLAPVPGSASGRVEATPPLMGNVSEAGQRPVSRRPPPNPMTRRFDSENPYR